MLVRIRHAITAIYAGIKAFARRVKRELNVWRHVLRDSHTPRLTKGLLWFGMAYALIPFDLIPDFIPVLGWLDDLLFVAVPIAIAIKIVPRVIVAEARKSIAAC
jgi:uncharacterized membrane protein YkvA (DUF1232 family)